MADYIRPVVFTLGGQKFGVDINLVQSIERQVDVVPVPNAMKYISGIVNLRGEVIPVMSLKKKFSMDDTAESKGNNTVIVNLPDMKIALEVVVSLVSIRRMAIFECAARVIQSA